MAKVADWIGVESVDVPTVVIMRGLHGSGKDTWIKEFRSRFPTNKVRSAVVSADEFFIHSVDGTYNFDPKYLGQAHAFCFGSFLLQLQDKTDLVIVNNTNSQMWEWANYAIAARLMGYRIAFKEMHRYPYDMRVVEIAEMHARNVHGVPRETVLAMALRWEQLPLDEYIIDWSPPAIVIPPYNNR